MTETQQIRVAHIIENG